MAVDVLIGLQWGDEGKGKIVDCIADNVRVFAKAGNSLIVQPGTNAHLKIYC